MLGSLLLSGDVSAVEKSCAACKDNLVGILILLIKLLKMKVCKQK